MGPDWLKLLGAYPKLILHGIGQIALFAVPVFLLLALVMRLVTRTPGLRKSRAPSAAAFLVLAGIAAVPAAIYVIVEPEALRRYAGDRMQPAPPPSARLSPPVGTDWPRDTRYLPLPLRAQGGSGVIRVENGIYRIHLKLCAAGEVLCPGLRHAVVQRQQAFEFRDLPAGIYEIRYLPIDRPTIGGRSRPIDIAADAPAASVVKITDSLSLGSRDAITGISPASF
jgi:hypothetical protein